MLLCPDKYTKTRDNLRKENQTLIGLAWFFSQSHRKDNHLEAQVMLLNQFLLT